MSASPTSRLIDAIFEDKSKVTVEVKTLIYEIGYSNPQLWSVRYELLCCAVQREILLIIEVLLKQGIDVNSSKLVIHGSTLLYYAANNNQIEVAELLIRYGADVNAKNHNGHLPITAAIEKINVDMTWLLLSSGTEIKYCPDLLFLAVKRRSIEIFYMILRFTSVDVNTTDMFGRTVLHWTVIPKITGGIIDKTAAGFRASYHDIECEMALSILSLGANVNARCKNNRTALHNAMSYGQTGVFKILLKYKADVNLMDNMNRTPLHNAVERGRISDVEILLKYKADVNITDSIEKTPLHYSAEGDNEAIVRMLLNNGARINDTDASGETALRIACWHSNEGIVATLLEFGADIELSDELDPSLLEIADQHGNLSIIKILLKNFTNMNHRDEDGRTPLHEVVLHDLPLVTRVLLDNGADINVTCNELLTPFEIAELYDSPRSRDILERHIVKMKALNMYVGLCNRKLIDILDKHKDFYEYCSLEVSSSKDGSLRHTNVTFHDLMTKDIDQLVRYARNPNIVETFKTGKYKKNLGECANMVYNNFKKGIKRNGLLNSGAISLNFLVGFVLPEIISEMVLNSLSNGELENLTKAGF